MQESPTRIRLGMAGKKDKDGKLDIIKEGNAGNPMTKGYTPLLTFDVWGTCLLPRLPKSKSRSFEWSMGYHRLESS